MTPTTPFSQLRQALADVERSGQPAVDISALLRFLDSVEADAPLDAQIAKLNHESQLAREKADHDRYLAFYRAKVDSEHEMFRSVIETAKTALSTSILVNGGATVALLAFVGNILSKSAATPAALHGALVTALVSFASGVLLGALATGTTYCAQYCYHHEFKRSGAAFHIGTVIFVVGSYLAFAAGIVGAYHAFLK